MPPSENVVQQITLVRSIFILKKGRGGGHVSADHIIWLPYCRMICTSRFCCGYLTLTQEALIFICTTWLWCPEGVTISVWGDSKGNAAHSRQQAKTDRSNKNQCITSYQPLQQPSPHSSLSFFPANHTSLSASIPFSPSPAFLFSFIFFFFIIFFPILICQFILLLPTDKVPHLHCTCDFINKNKELSLFAHLQEISVGQGVKRLFLFNNLDCF